MGKTITLFSDAAGDFRGLDSFEPALSRRDGATGYQYKFYPSPLSDDHRSEILKALSSADKTRKRSGLKKWIVVTPEDLIESPTRRDGGDVTWFEDLRKKLARRIKIEHWGHKHLLALFLDTKSLCLYYYPELVPEGSERQHTIQDIEKRYQDNLATLYREIIFVGMSVYKPEATKGIPMEHIYIPLTVLPNAATEDASDVSRVDPLKLARTHGRYVVLGDPGSGKSTLLRFLALVGRSEALQERGGAAPDDRLPILVTLRRYADELKTRSNLSLLDYVCENVRADLSLPMADASFFEYYLENGRAILLFDGLDELGTPHLKGVVRDRIQTLSNSYPGNTVIITSRIVGYDNPFRFDEREFAHFRLTKLRLQDMEQFVKDWYRVRIENESERDANVQDLIRILRDDEHLAIRELAENPLLLTIVALVHRIDAVLPDERVVLYQKCTETLLNTWHTWKFRGAEIKNKGKVERRNRRRMEAMAYWMHCQAGATGKAQRAVVTYADLHAFLTKHIQDVEKTYDPKGEPEELAEEFLEFVKKRAGLLIELGDGRYSFVHLTFQEYLASTNIITLSEKQGVENLWNLLREHCDDPRWTEVIRLLVAGLKSEDSQRFLIESVFALKEKKPRDNHLSLLLGGLLLDGIDHAQLREAEILTALLDSCQAAHETEQIVAATSVLNTWLRKEEGQASVLDEALLGLRPARRSRKSINTVSLALTRYAINWPRTKPSSLSSNSFATDDRPRALLKLFFADTLSSAEFAVIAKDVTEFSDLLLPLIHDSPETNFVASCSQAATWGIPPEVRARGNFERLLMLFLNLGYVGPLFDYVFNSLRISNPDFPIGEIPDMRMPELRERIEAMGREIRNALRPGRSRGGGRPMTAIAMPHIRAIRGSGLRRLRHFAGWSDILLDPSRYNIVLEFLCRSFSLRPKAQWREALRVGFLADVPRRLDLFSQTSGPRIEKRFERGTTDDADLCNGAFHLMLDAILFLYGVNDFIRKSRIRRLAELSRDMTHPAIVVARCLRDLAYGEARGGPDLRSALERVSPVYARVGVEWFPSGPLEKVAIQGSLAMPADTVAQGAMLSSSSSEVADKHQ